MSDLSQTLSALPPSGAPSRGTTPPTTLHAPHTASTPSNIKPQIPTRSRASEKPALAILSPHSSRRTPHTNGGGGHPPSYITTSGTHTREHSGFVSLGSSGSHSPMAVSTLSAHVAESPRGSPGSIRAATSSNRIGPYIVGKTLGVGSTGKLNWD